MRAGRDGAVAPEQAEEDAADGCDGRAGEREQRAGDDGGGAPPDVFVCVVVMRGSLPLTQPVRSGQTPQAQGGFLVSSRGYDRRAASSSSVPQTVDSRIRSDGSSKPASAISTGRRPAA
jgi:hypothetical protein